MKKIIIVIFILFLPFIIHAQTTIDEIYLLTVDGTIGPPIANYIIDRIETAEAHDAAVLIEIDTPGGLDTSMREIIQKIMNADVPVIGYVTPEGARAASAGAIIMLACDISAMTPTSSIGAAHPVSMGAKIDSTMEKKWSMICFHTLHPLPRKQGAMRISQKRWSPKAYPFLPEKRWTKT